MKFLDVSIASRRVENLEFFFFNEIIIEPNAPNDADSVGVAIPNKIEPKTITIRNIGGIYNFNNFYKI